MNRFSWTRLAIVLVSTLGAVAPEGRAAEPLWRQLVPRKRVDADPKADYSLSERNGPWHIMAASFNGEEGERDARELVLELRDKFNLPAYYYAMTFHRDDLNVGRGIDESGQKIKRRYQSGDVALQHAVLVGDFPTIDDPEAQDLLERVKTLTPKSLEVASGENNTQSLSTVRSFYSQVRKQLGKPVMRGPMGHAFMTRNPMLPEQYFTGVGVEPDVAKWNEKLEYTLLNCKGKYTIKVATFRGRSTLSGNDEEPDSKIRTRRPDKDDPLVVAGENAHNLVVALREKGWEAYEFHDRNESYVTIGSFDEMEQSPDGRLVSATREEQIIVDTFGAATPSPELEQPSYETLGVKQAEARKLEEKQEAILAQFQSTYSATKGEIAEGFHPKRFVGLPFDIHPQPILTPKKSISAQYVRN